MLGHDVFLALSVLRTAFLLLLIDLALLAGLHSQFAISVIFQLNNSEPDPAEFEGVADANSVAFDSARGVAVEELDDLPHLISRLDLFLGGVFHTLFVVDPEVLFFFEHAGQHGTYAFVDGADILEDDLVVDAVEDAYAGEQEALTGTNGASHISSYVFAFIVEEPVRITVPSARADADSARSDQKRLLSSLFCSIFVFRGRVSGPRLGPVGRGGLHFRVAQAHLLFASNIIILK